MGRTTEGSEFESRYGKEFSLFQVIEIGSGVHQTSYPVRIGGFSPGVKWPWREAEHSPSAIAEVKKMWIYTSTPPYAFITLFN
jgi:hypothetical protein